MTKTHRVVWMALAILFLVASKATAQQGCAANGASLTHPGLPFVPGLPGHSIIIQVNLNLVGQADGTCPPPSSCTFTYQSNVTVDVSPAATPVAGELCLTQALGTIPILCGPAPAGLLAPTGVPGQYSAGFGNVNLSAGCGETFEWTVRIWFDWGGLGGPLVLPVLTALLQCTGC